jgi:hypothetical protein|tara:strand:+ start:386 stop:655 length:270 start_codon:yes stop_codon:yes gene_type:complete
MRKFDELFTEADAAFNGKYKNELGKLNGLSKDEIGAVTPRVEDLRVYSILIKVVEKASMENISMTQLAVDIKELGGIARKIPEFRFFLK